MMASILARYTLLCAALVLAAAAADRYTTFNVWNTVTAREHYHNVWLTLSDPDVSAQLLFRNLANSTTNSTEPGKLGLNWAYDYENEMTCTFDNFAKTVRFTLRPLNAVDDIYPSMTSVDIEVSVSPLTFRAEEPSSTVNLGANVGCGTEASCNKLLEIWNEELGVIANNVRVAFGSPCTNDDAYTIDGSCNNLSRDKYSQGASFTNHVRLGGILYADGISAPNGASRPNPRVISNAVVQQQPDTPKNKHGLNTLLVLWGQLVDHELTFFQELHPGDEPLPIAVPKGDPGLDPNDLGNVTIKFTRSQAVRFTGTSKQNPRQILNTITAYIDGSFVYGSSAPRHYALREFKGGRLLTGAADFLPQNSARYPNADAFIAVPIQARPTLPVGTFANATFFLAGDVRANENVHLAALHTLLMREHNRVADLIAAAVAPLGWGDQEIFDQARRVVAAEMQYITFEQFAPALLGAPLPAYTGYDVDVDPSVDLVFSTAFFRIGHTLFPDTIQRLNADLTSIPEGAISLNDSFFAPYKLITEGGMDPVFRGMLVQHAEEIDTQIVDNLRSFLFGPPGTGLGGSDLSCLNMQRGRDHAIPDLNLARELLGLSRHTSFNNITSNAKLASALESLYKNVDDIDLWVGMLAEDHIAGAPLGPVVKAGIQRQLVAVRDGDRLYYRNAPLPAIVRSTLGEDLSFIDGAKVDVLANIIRHNTGVDVDALPIQSAFVTKSDKF